MFREHLKERQPIVERVLYNALHHKQASHAYLFTGPKGSKMFETAILLAQSLVCEHADPWACEHCDSCVRIQSGIFADMVILDGTDTSIKKDHVLSMQEKFSRTALEKYGRKFYIVKAAENATTEALNSLLKFLEEPSGHDTYAILISEKPERLLETIVSRCQTLTFKPQDRQVLMDSLQESDLDPYELHLLTQMVNDQEELLELQSSELFRQCLTSFGEFIDEYNRAPYLGEIYLQNNLLKRKDAQSDRQRLTLFLNIGMMFFKDVLFKTQTQSSEWKSRLYHIPRQIKALAAFTIFNDSVHKIGGNANLGLLIDALLYQLKEEEV
jgi:DNA polymerase-3 subunit delta'